MKILVVGSGGREHSLGWKLRQSPRVTNIYFAPGNGGTDALGENIGISVDNVKGIIAWAKTHRIDLIVVGPEIPLEKGIVDLAERAGLTIFGPSKKAARLETDKAWALQFMKRHTIPHPDFKVFTRYDKALQFLKTCSWLEIVIKASGLAAGKGVVLPDSPADAENAIKNIMVKKVFGSAGDTLIIQERIKGWETSLLAFTDGKNIIPMLSAQDYKRARDGDKGLNTGGMGCFAPVPKFTTRLMKKAYEFILKPTIDGMREERIPYKGILYAGLMITEKGLQVIEFNARFGDPETQPLMMLLDSDLLRIMQSCIDETLNKSQVSFKKGSAVCVVLASGGYPGKYKTKKLIHGLDEVSNQNIVAFHASTTLTKGKILTNGGRVMGLTASAKNIEAARRKVYENFGKKGIRFSPMHYRIDIARNI